MNCWSPTTLKSISMNQADSNLNEFVERIVFYHYGPESLGRGQSRTGPANGFFPNVKS